MVFSVEELYKKIKQKCASLHGLEASRDFTVRVRLSEFVCLLSCQRMDPCALYSLRTDWCITWKDRRWRSPTWCPDSMSREISEVHPQRSFSLFTTWMLGVHCTRCLPSVNLSLRLDCCCTVQTFEGDGKPGEWILWRPVFLTETSSVGYLGSSFLQLCKRMDPGLIPLFSSVSCDVFFVADECHVAQTVPSALGEFIDNSIEQLAGNLEQLRQNYGPDFSPRIDCVLEFQVLWCSVRHCMFNFRLFCCLLLLRMMSFIIVFGLPTV